MTNTYPTPAFQFTVRLDNANAPISGGFSEVSGLSAEIDIAEIPGGGKDGQNRFAHRLPSVAKTPNLVLKRGMIPANSDLMEWCKEALEGSLSNPIKPRTIFISLIEQAGVEMISWTAERAWPVKWTVASPVAEKSELAVETIEFAYLRLTRTIAPSASSPGLH